MGEFLHILSTTKHKLWVLYFTLEFSAKLIWRGIIHDNSKYSIEEASYFSKVILKLKKLEYGSKEYKECLRLIKPALDHHYKNNRHHPENHGKAKLLGMSLVDIVEMFADWQAAVKRHDSGDIAKSVLINAERFETGIILEKILLNSIKGYKFESTEGTEGN